MTLAKITKIKTERFIGTILECDGNGDGKYGNTIEKWIIHDVLGLNEYNTGEGPDIPGNGEFRDIEIKSRRLNTKSHITITGLNDNDLESYDNWSRSKKKKANSDLMFVVYDVYDDVIEIKDIIVIHRNDYTDVFELSIKESLKRPNKVVNGVIVETGKYPKLRINEQRLKKDIIRMSSKSHGSTIDNLFEF